MKNPDPDRYDVVGGVPTWELWAFLGLVCVGLGLAFAGAFGWLPS